MRPAKGDKDGVKSENQAGGEDRTHEPQVHVRQAQTKGRAIRPAYDPP